MGPWRPMSGGPPNRELRRRLMALKHRIDDVYFAARGDDLDEAHKKACGVLQAAGVIVADIDRARKNRAAEEPEAPGGSQ